MALSMLAGIGDMSPDDALVVLSMQLEDLERLNQRDKGKYVSGRPSDQILAMNEYHAEIDRQKRLLEDSKLARSIAQAVYNDAAILNQLATQDIQAYEDRNYALQISREDAECEDPPSRDNDDTASVMNWVSTISDSLQGRSLATLEFIDDEANNAGPSMTYSQRQVKTLEKLSEQFRCNACLENHHAAMMIKLPCEHRFCGGCVKELFMRSIKDQPLFPPRCCRQEIPPSMIRNHMSPDEIEAFETASIEFTTIDKTYCSNSECGKFIPPETNTLLPRAARCKACTSLTCVKCKGAYHDRRGCPKDPSLEHAKQLAREMGWQECPQCHSFVELRSGCYHMTCRCKAEFCYLCGVTWQGCHCRRADAAFMEERAAEIVERDANQDMAPAQRARMVNQVRDHLLENHECTHSRHFERLTSPPRRGYRCELCDDRHWHYILQCRRCLLNVCEECRRHRV